MSTEKTLALISNLTTASIMATILWLYVDALLFRFEVKSFIKAAGFLLLTGGVASNFAESFLVVNQTFITWIIGLGFWMLFVGFILDTHSRLQLLTIFLIVAVLFLKNHLLLSVEVLLVTLAVLQLSYIYKHKDVIPLITAFFLVSLAEFLKYLNNFKGFENMSLSASILYIFASVTLLYWLWSYLTIRFNLKHKSTNQPV